MLKIMNLFIINNLNFRISKHIDLILNLNVFIEKLLILQLISEMVEVGCSIGMNECSLIGIKGLVRWFICNFLLSCDCLVVTCIFNNVLIIFYPFVKNQLTYLNILLNTPHFLLKTVRSYFNLFLKTLILLVFKIYYDLLIEIAAWLFISFELFVYNVKKLAL